MAVVDVRTGSVAERRYVLYLYLSPCLLCAVRLSMSAAGLSSVSRYMVLRVGSDSELVVISRQPDP